MDNPIQNYWQIRLAHVKESLEGNNFEAFIAENVEEAKQIMKEEILPKLKDIKIDSEEFENKEGKQVRVSTIELVMRKK